MSVRCYEKFRDKSDEINGLMSFCLSPNVFLPFSWQTIRSKQNVWIKSAYVDRVWLRWCIFMCLHSKSLFKENKKTFVFLSHIFEYFLAVCLTNFVMVLIPIWLAIFLVYIFLVHYFFWFFFLFIFFFSSWFFSWHFVLMNFSPNFLRPWFFSKR